jgi:regulation of enolase protein 1 (concanavalin A-like superfamily)
LVSFILLLDLSCYVSAADVDVKIPSLLSQKPILDGIMDDVWFLSTEQFITKPGEGSPPSSPEDCSGSWWALWDSEYLYVLIDVNDEALMQDSDAGSGWNDDRVEVLVDGDNSKNTSTDGKNDYQYCFRWNNAEVETPVEWYFRTSGIDKLTGVEYAVATTDSGYLFEIKLPWSIMTGEPPQEGQLIGIDIIIDDDDDGGARDSQLGWHTEVFPPHNPSQWGTALLDIPMSDKARNPSPADEAIEVSRDTPLKWKPGLKASKHNVYFGKVLTDVNNADVLDPRGVLVGLNQTNTTYIPTGSLEFGQTYYWRVDEVNDADPNSPWKGDLWSFTVANFIIVDNFEDYNDESNRIYNVWTDYFTNNTGMTVGHFDPPFAERGIVHSGRQAMYVHYDNDGTVNEDTEYEQTGTLLYSEVERQWADAQDWTREGVNSLGIWFRGLSESVRSFTAGATSGSYTMAGAGADIWEKSDSFHFAYKQLTGTGGITVRVLSLTDTHDSAKAGVMIRESLEPGSVHAMVDIQPMNEVQFLRRTMADYTSEADGVGEISTPVWLKLNRAGNTFTARYSIDGVSWEMFNTIAIPMNSEVYIGLIVCSHDKDATCVAEFSDVKTIGMVTGDWQSQDIGIKTNVPEAMYVVLEDNAGNNAVIKHPDEAATNTASWTEWNIPLTDFTGVSLLSIQKIIIGVGDKANPQAGGAGDLYIDDIRLYRP